MIVNTSKRKKFHKKNPNLTYQSLGDVYFATAMMLILYFISERDNLNHSRPCHFNAVLVFQPSMYYRIVEIVCSLSIIRQVRLGVE